MQKLSKEIKNLMNSETGAKAKNRIKEFSEFKNHSNEKWFSELCFCLLTANTSAEMGLRVQKKITAKQFLSLPEKKLALELKKAGSRFHNRRANFIVNARKFSGIKEILFSLPEKEKRSFLVKNIKGFGLKEASHFLRNTGNFNYAIIDRHVWNAAKENGLIKKEKLNEKKTGNKKENKPEEKIKLNEKNYLLLEKKLSVLAEKLNLSLGELDLFLWFTKTGKIFK